MRDFKKPRYTYIETDEPLWLKIVGGVGFVFCFLLLCFI
jgi:hypothetical protein